jgi:hypothetical protein
VTGSSRDDNHDTAVEWLATWKIRRGGVVVAVSESMQPVCRDAMCDEPVRDGLSALKGELEVAFGRG